MENKLSEGIYWVGVHFPEPAPGGSLNSFLIKDEKTTVIDTGAPATSQMVVENIKQLVNPNEIDYIILTHADLDHGGGLASLIAQVPQATVIASEVESRSLGAWGVQVNVKTVADGETFSLGNHTLKFISIPFSCSPSTLAVFEENTGTLFSADLFAAPGPSEWSLWAEGDMTESLKMMQSMKLGNTQYTRDALNKVKQLPVKIIASGHGAIIRDRIEQYENALANAIN